MLTYMQKLCSIVYSRFRSTYLVGH